MGDEAGDAARADTRPRERWRWAGLGALCLVITLTCLSLANWQWGRHVHRQESNRLISANYDAPPVPLPTLLASPSSAFSSTDRWRAASAEGHYRADETVLLRGRTINSESVFHVIVPFSVEQGADAGATWLIDRGFVPAGHDGAAPAIPPPPEGRTQVTARLQPFERPNARTAPAGQVYSITPAAASGGQVLGAYGILVSENPAATTAPAPLPRPKIDFGNHLSYAMQWCVFALAAPIALIVLARRDRSAKAGMPRPPQRTGRAEAEEDAEVERLLAEQER